MALRIEEQDLRVAGMSAYMQPSDQFMTNMGLPQAAFLAVGSDEGALNLVNADTLTVERIAQIQQEQDRGRDQDVDIAMSALENSMREHLERLMDGATPVSVGWITMTVDEWEDVEDTLADPDGRDAVTEALLAQGYSAQEAAQIILVMEAMARVARAEAQGVPPSPADQAIIDNAQDDPRMRSGVTDGLYAVQETRGNSLGNSPQAEISEATVDAETLRMTESGSFSAEQGEDYRHNLSDYGISKEYEVASADQSPETLMETTVEAEPVARRALGLG